MRSFFLWDTDAEIFPEGIRDKIFGTEIVAALVRALDDSNSYARRSAVEILTAAIAQGTLLYFHEILTFNYSQRGFGTRYLTLRSSPQLDVHSAIVPVPGTSETT